MPARLSERDEKVPTPETAATVTVPARVALVGLFASERVMLPLELVTTLSKASMTVTRMAGLAATPAVRFGGCTVNASREADPGVMVWLWLIAVIPEAVAVRLGTPTTVSRK